MPGLARAMGQRSIMFCIMALALPHLFYTCSAPPRPSKQRQTAFHFLRGLYHLQALVTSPDRLARKVSPPPIPPPSLSVKIFPVSGVSLIMRVPYVPSAKSCVQMRASVKEGALHSQGIDGDGWVPPDCCCSSGIQTMVGQGEMPMVTGRAWCLDPGPHWLTSDWLYHHSCTMSP